MIVVGDAFQVFNFSGVANVGTDVPSVTFVLPDVLGTVGHHAAANSSPNL